MHLETSYGWGAGKTGRNIFQMGRKNLAAFGVFQICEILHSAQAKRYIVLTIIYRESSEYRRRTQRLNA